MSKQIKTTDTNLEVNTSQIIVVEIGGFSFEVDERYPWIDIYAIGGENKEFIREIDDVDISVITDINNLKIFAMNWYFDNVQVVKEM